MLKGIIQKTSKTGAAYLVAGIALIQLAPVFFNTFPPEELFGISEEFLMQIILSLWESVSRSASSWPISW